MIIISIKSTNSQCLLRNTESMWRFFMTRGQKRLNELLTYNCFRSWSKPYSMWVCRIFSQLKQWPCTHGWSWRGDICTLVTRHKKPNKSDQTHSSIQAAYQFFLSAQKASEEAIIVTLWQFKAQLSLLLSFHCWHRVIDLTWNALHGSKTKCVEWNLPSARDIRICFHNTHEEEIHHVWKVWHSFFSPKQTVIRKTVEKEKNTSLDRTTVKGGQTFFSTKPFFFWSGSPKEHQTVINV